MTKFAAILLGLAAIAGLGFFLDSDTRLKGGASAETTSAFAAQRFVIHAAGRVEGATEEADLLPELMGRAIAIPVSDGDQVQAGDVLLQLDDRMQRTEELLREAEVAVAEAELERLVNGARAEERRESAAKHRALIAQINGAKKRLDRAIGLLATNSISQQQVDDHVVEAETLEHQIAAAQAHLELLEAPAREDEVHRANARIAAARAQLELARAQREKMVLRAPAAGTVLEVFAQLGELVGPESDQPAIVFADASRLFVRAFVEELDAPRIQSGMVASVTADGLAGRAFGGRIVKIAPRMSKKQLMTDDPNEHFDTKVREVWLELESPLGLLIGLRVDVVFDEGKLAKELGNPKL